MKCRNCGHELEKGDVKVDIASHDDSMLAIIIECPKCNHKVNTFVSESDFVDMNIEE
jgi:rubredoxin